MSTVQNKAAMQRLYDEVINRGNMDLADELIAADVVEHEEFPGITQGIEGFKQFFRMFRQAFPDLHFTVEDMLADADRVVSRISIRGTHKDVFMDIPPTGKRIDVQAIDICRFAEGKMVEHWGQTDALGMMEQLGVVPSGDSA